MTHLMHWVTLAGAAVLIISSSMQMKSASNLAAANAMPKEDVDKVKTTSGINLAIGVLLLLKCAYKMMKSDGYVGSMSNYSSSIFA